MRERLKQRPDSVDLEIPPRNSPNWYPFKPGKYGIPMAQIILSDRQLFDKEGTVISGSGRKIKYCFRPNYVEITDSLNENYRLIARYGYLDEQGVSFETFSRARPPKIFPFKIRHQDLFAGAFIRFTLEFFKENGYEITICEGVWWPYSQNFHEFHAEVRRGKNQSEAALATWSGRHYSRLGFGLVTEEDIYLKYSRKGEEYLHVRFRRNN